MNWKDIVRKEVFEKDSSKPDEDKKGRRRGSLIPKNKKGRRRGSVIPKGSRSAFTSRD